MSRRAAIDIGTNSVRLLVADVAEGRASSPIHPVLHRLQITRLGERMPPGGQILPAAAARTAEAVRQFIALARDAGAPRPVLVGTHALRSARNPDEFLSRLDRPVRILSGDDEARQGYRGVLAGLARRRSSSRLLVIDIGGGSVELTWGRGDRIETSLSVPVGAVVLTERFLAHDPPHPTEIAALRAHLAQALDPRLVAVPEEPHRLVGVGGTITSMAAIEQRLSPYDPSQVHGYRLSRRAVATMAEELAASTVAERRCRAGLQPERADIIAAGALVLEHILTKRRARAVTVSEADLLWALVVGERDTAEPGPDADREGASR